MKIEADAPLGRERELVALERFLGTLEEGPAVLVLEGEAGIGKTVLVVHALGEAGICGYRVLAARPTNAESSLSFVGLSDLLSDVHELFGELPLPQRRGLAAALLLDESAEAPDPRAIGMGLLGVLRMLAASRPVVVAVDDLQWLDTASAAALSFAVRRVTKEPIGLLVATRTLPGPAETALVRGVRGERVALGSLSVGAIHALLAERLRLSIPRSLLLRIHDVCRGNPLFALEIGRALLERGLPEPGRPFEIPADAEALFAARLEQLPKDTLDALAVATSIAAPTRSFVRAASADALEPALRADIIRLEGERIHFTHPLLASAVYARLDPGSRCELHRCVAAAVTDREERARHLALAADGPDPRVAAALDEAAEHTAQRGAPAVAAELAELAVKLTPDRDTDRLRTRRGIAAHHHLLAGDVAWARRILEGLIAELPAGAERGRALLKLAETQTGDYAAIQPLCEQAVFEAAGDDRVLAVALRELANTLLWRGDPVRGLARARAAVVAAERTGDVRLLVLSLACVALQELGTGRVTRELLDRALSLEPQAGYLPLWNSPATVDGLRLMALADDLDAARLRLADAEQIARDHGDDASRTVLLTHLAEVECRAGRLDDAAGYANEAYELRVQFGLSTASPLYFVALADALRGRTDAARVAAERGLALANETGNDYYAVRNQFVLGLLALSGGDASTAARILAPLSEQHAARGHGRLSSIHVSGLPDAIEALLAVGELERAAKLLEQLDETGRLGIRYAQARAARCRGLLAAAARDFAAAFCAFEVALSAHERLPDPLERGRTLLALGQTQRRAGRRRDARGTLQKAVVIFDEIGAATWAERARAELRRVGGRARSAAALTPAEERVAHLVAEGRTNREVAGALFVTERTVEAHLTSIYRKLKLRSRSELAGHMAGGTAA